MNNKGFSLAELLAVIALLAVLLLIFTPNITKIIDNFREEDQVNILKNNAISAAKEYVVDGYITADDVDDGVVYIKVKDKLIQENYLTKNDWYSSDHQIRVEYDSTNKKFVDYKYCVTADTINDICG